jgi:hypothetical protein
VLHGGWLDDHSAKVVTEQPLGPTLGAINRDDAKPLGRSLLNALLDDAGWLADVPPFALALF